MSGLSGEAHPRDINDALRRAGYTGPAYPETERPSNPSDPVGRPLSASEEEYQRTRAMAEIVQVWRTDREFARKLREGLGLDVSDSVSVPIILPAVRLVLRQGNPSRHFRSPARVHEKMREAVAYRKGADELLS